MKFTKMHGAGNDYLYVDCFEQPVPDNADEIAKLVSHRHFGVGGDGIIFICKSDKADVRMQMHNADGSQAEMCGNGIRCLAKYAYDHGLAPKTEMLVETGAGVLSLNLHPGSDGRIEEVTVDMGPPILEASQVPTTILDAGSVVDHVVDFNGNTFSVTCVSMGNPHCIIFVPKATDDLVLGIGPIIENDPRFRNRTNVEFVEILSRQEVRQRTWERGSGETWACGTGASAVCVAGVLTGRTDRKIRNHLLGGDLILDWDETSGHVMMTGPAVEVFQGEWPTN
jgi:diaminopimelate epimerase